MSWLSSFVKHNRGFIGNAIKNVSPALAFTPLGILGAGAAGALGRAIQPGAKLGDIVKSGVSNAAIGGGARGGMAALRSAFAPSSSAAGTVAATGGVSPASVPGVTSAIPDSALGITTPTTAPAAGGGALRTIGSFLKDNPNAVAGGLEGLGRLGTMGSENAYRNAETDALRQNTSMNQYELEQKKRQAAALEPLLRALMGQMGTNTPYTVAPNPYT